MEKMKRILKKCLILLIFPVHVIITLLRDFGHGYLVLLILLMLFADFVLSALQMELFTSRRNSIRAFAAEYLPYLLEKCAVIAVEWLIMHFAVGEQGDLYSEEFGIWIFFGCALITMLVSALVTFAAGAARTMMYHDEKR
ncbi:MAG: hypothetical protein IKX57_03615 [Oscillospiraceae bacterium]|nr:hypothetical protein [Oscillospiraceae bacterium]